MKKPTTKKLLKEWSAKVRAEGKCAICGRTKYVQAHHLCVKERWPALKFELKNGLPLCAKCHRLGKFSAHRNPLWFAWWMAQNRPETYHWCMEQMGVVQAEEEEKPTFGFHPMEACLVADPIIMPAEILTEEGENRNLAKIRI